MKGTYFHLISICNLLLLALIYHIRAEYKIAPITDRMRAVADAVLEAQLPENGVTQESSVAWSRLAEICDTFGPRIAGSEELENALTWIKTVAESDGLRVTEEPTMVSKWVRGEEWVYMVEPRAKKLHMIGLGMSVGTRGQNITAEAFVVSGKEDLMLNCSHASGRIVVFNTPFTEYGKTVSVRYNAGRWAAECGALAALIRSIGPFSMQNPHTGLTANATIPAAAISLEDASQLNRMQKRGQKIVLSLYMESSFYPPSPSRNLLIDLVGSEKPDEVVLISGHGDSWDIGEGAMDDGGGFIAAWESVRLLKQLNVQPKRTIRAVIWVDEEKGGAGGKQYVADYYRANENGTDDNSHSTQSASANPAAIPLSKHSILIESDSGAFTPLGLSISCAFNQHGGCNATIAQLNVLSELLVGIGGGQILTGEGGADIDPSCETGVVCGGLRVLDQRLSTSGRTASSNSENNPCTINSLNAWNVPTLVDSSLEYNSGYFFYHHSDADTIERIDPYQLNQVSAALAVWAFAVAELPTLLPRDDIATISSSAPAPYHVDLDSLNFATVILVVLFAVILILFGGGLWNFVINKDSAISDRFRSLFCIKGKSGRETEFSVLSKSSHHGRDDNDLE